MSMKIRVALFNLILAEEVKLLYWSSTHNRVYCLMDAIDTRIRVFDAGSGEQVDDYEDDMIVTMAQKVDTFNRVINHHINFGKWS